MGYLPEVSRMGRKILPTRVGRRLGRAWGEGSGEDWREVKGETKKEEKEKPSSAPCRIVHAQPFNLLSAFSCRGENVTLA